MINYNEYDHDSLKNAVIPLLVVNKNRQITTIVVKNFEKIKKIRKLKIL